MLKFLLGPDHKVYRKELISQLLEDAKNATTKQYLIVPEQFSFETEVELCRRGGNQICLKAEVLSLSRLADRVESAYGGRATTFLDHGGQLLAVTQAVEQVHSRLKYFASVCRKTDFAEAFLSAADEFSNYGITSEKLLGLSAASHGQFAQKLEELAILYESYLSVCAQASDPAKRLQHLCELLRTGDFAEEKNFYICGFTDFTTLEKEIIEELILSAKNVYMALPAEGEVFAAAAGTERELSLFCHEHGVLVDRVYLGFDETVPEDLLYLQKNVVVSASVSAFPSSQNVRFSIFSSPEEECRAAAEKIAQYVNGGGRYSDICIACADMESYKSLLQSVLRRSGIPAYFSGKEGILGNNATHMVLSAVRACAEGLDRESVIDYIKSGVVTLDDDACDRLENYATLWNIRGNRWSEEWTLHPSGISSEWHDSDYRLLADLNTWKTIALAPLLTLRQSLQAATCVRDMADAVLQYTEDVSLHERMQTLSDRAYDGNDFALAQVVAQIYDAITNVIEQLRLVIPDAVRSVDEFGRLFTKLLSQYSVASVPATLNQVSVGEINLYRNRSVRFLLILGAQENVFPAYGQSAGVFTEQERLNLIRLGLSMAPLHVDIVDRSLGHIYAVIRSATESLCVSCCAADASHVFLRFAEIAGGAKKESCDALLDEAEMAVQAVRNEEERVPEFLLDRVTDLQQRRNYTFGTIAPENVRKLYGESIYLSASRIDKFAACRFAFFLRYGLKASTVEEVRFDASEFGTFVHEILEKTARRVMELGGFRSVSEVQLLEIADLYMREYANTVLRDMQQNDTRFAYVFDRNCEEATAIVKDLGNEMRASDFVPAAFELSFGKGCAMEPIAVHGKNAEGFVSGFVDRVDLYEHNDCTYVRVVDYKTGRKTFDYAELTVGEGLQMLVYLFALKKNGAAYFGKPLQPAGVLYHPARKDMLSAAERMDTQEAEDLHSDALVRKGLIVDDDVVIHAMEHFEGSPKYLPIKYKKNGERSGDLANHDEIRELEDYVYRTLERITDEIYSGEVQPNPVIRGTGNSACTYCDFADVCQKDMAKHQERHLKKISNREFFKEIQAKEDR